MALTRNYDDIDFLDWVWAPAPPRIFGGIGYAERICLERWVSECEPRLVYGGRDCRLLGLALNGDPASKLVVHAPPTDRFYIPSGTGYPPDWDFYKRNRVAESPK